MIFKNSEVAFGIFVTSQDESLQGLINQYNYT